MIIKQWPCLILSSFLLVATHLQPNRRTAQVAYGDVRTQIKGNEKEKKEDINNFLPHRNFPLLEVKWSRSKDKGEETENGKEKKTKDQNQHCLPLALYQRMTHLQRPPQQVSLLSALYRRTTLQQRPPQQVSLPSALYWWTIFYSLLLNRLVFYWHYTGGRPFYSLLLDR